MPLKTLIVIALRLYAIYWLVDSLSQILIYFPTFFAFMSQGSPGVGMQGIYALILIPLGMLAFAAILWFLSSRLSSPVTKGHDTQFTFTLLTREDIYRFAFVFLGVFFALSSIFSMVQTGYQIFAYDYPQPDSNPEKGRYLSPFLGHAFTMIVGFVCVFGAGNWTKKLIRLENKNETPPPAV